MKNWFSPSKLSIPNSPRERRYWFIKVLNNQLLKISSTISSSAFLFILKMYSADPNMKMNMKKIKKNGRISIIVYPISLIKKAVESNTLSHSSIFTHIIRAIIEARIHRL